MRGSRAARPLSGALLGVAAVATAQGTALASAVVLTPPPTAAATVGGPLLAGTGVVRGPGTPALPKVTAASWVVADAVSGEILAAKAPHVRMRPASTLKALAALVLQPALSPRQVHLGSDADTRVEGSRAGIVVGGHYTVDQLFQAVFLRSGNDAIRALADLHGGVARTVADMNAEARHLNALDTYVVTPEGLDAAGQLSSAYDLALIGRAALANQAIVRYATTRSARFPGGPGGPGNRHPTFALWTQQKYVLSYPGALGLKNGYTTLAHNTLIAAARRGHRTVLVTLMGGGAGTWREAAALSTWYFASGEKATPVGLLVPPGTPAQPSFPPPAVVPGVAVASTVTAVQHGAGSPLKALVGIPAALAALVAGLRTRVLWRRHRRARLRRAGP